MEAIEFGLDRHYAADLFVPKALTALARLAERQAAAEHGLAMRVAQLDAAQTWYRDHVDEWGIYDACMWGDPFSRGVTDA